jgi:tripartite-type tricarboxylate transporter receptor subunit TctC
MNRLLLACIVVGAVVSTADAQNFPNQAIKIIVPFTPGGSNDVVAREIAQGLQTRLKQTAVVENRPGGGGTIAYQFVAKAPPDGHTLMIAPASFTMGPHLSKKQLYHPVKEFAAINLVADVPFVMVVPASLPVKSVKEFIALAKSSPKKLTFGSVGQGTPQHLAGELFKMSAGVDLIHVPFRGATAVLPDLIAGRIDMFIGAVNSLLELLADGKLKALATTSTQRIPSLPDLPTMAEVGLPDVQIGSGVGLVAPAGTPPAVIETLHREITAIIADKGFHERMAKIGVDVVGTSVADYAKFLAEDYAKWGKVVAAAKIEPQ